MSDTRGREVRGRRLCVHAAHGLEKRRQSRSLAQIARNPVFPAHRAGGGSRGKVSATDAAALWIDPNNTNAKTYLENARKARGH
ncbi:MAG: hypothetical protein LBK73_12750 [Treponema sp.]|nr:hypothetical protein [Treponema sp.]